MCKIFKIFASGGAMADLGTIQRISTLTSICDDCDMTLFGHHHHKYHHRYTRYSLTSIINLHHYSFNDQARSTWRCAAEEEGWVFVHIPIVCICICGGGGVSIPVSWGSNNPDDLIWRSRGGYLAIFHLLEDQTLQVGWYNMVVEGTRPNYVVEQINLKWVELFENDYNFWK